MGAVGYGGLVVADENYELPILDGTFSRSWAGWSKLYDYLVEAEESTPTDPVIGRQTFKEPDGTVWTRQPDGYWRVTITPPNSKRSLGDTGTPGDLRGKDGYLVIDNPVYDGNSVSARLDNGRLSIMVDAPNKEDIENPPPDYVKIPGYLLWDMVFTHFGVENIDVIECNWQYGDNLAQVNNRLINEPKLTTGDAVKTAWSAKQAERHGFTESTVTHKEGEEKGGKLTHIRVEFRRPK